MSSKYQKAFIQFLSEVKQLPDAKNAHCELSEEVLNAVLITGEIVGEDTKQKLNEIGRKYDLLALANELTVLDRTQVQSQANK